LFGKCSQDDIEKILKLTVIPYMRFPGQKLAVIKTSRQK